jgi:hypothetical protein
MIDVYRAIGRLLEPDDQVEVVALDIEPLKWQPGRLYVWPVRLEEFPYETGSGVIQDADVRAVLVVPNELEEARQMRSEDLAAFLDAKLETYLAAVRRHPLTTYWHHARGSRATSPRTLDNRGVAVNVRIQRFVN